MIRRTPLQFALSKQAELVETTGETFFETTQVPKRAHTSKYLYSKSNQQILWDRVWMIPDGVPPVKVSRQGRGTRSHLTNLQAGIVCDRPTAEMIWSRTSMKGAELRPPVDGVPLKWYSMKSGMN